MGSWLEGYPHLDIAGPSSQSFNPFKVWSRLFRLHLASEWLLSPVSHADSELFFVFTQLFELLSPDNAPQSVVCHLPLQAD